MRESQNPTAEQAQDNIESTNPIAVTNNATNNTGASVNLNCVVREGITRSGSGGSVNSSTCGA
jgi:hypothetical protein